MTVELKVKKLHPEAIIPAYATDGSAAMDLHALFDASKPERKVWGNGSLVVRTGLSFEIPEGYAMLILSRSGMGFRENTRLANCVGLIDEDYPGEIKVAIHNDSDRPKKISHGDRIAQLVVVPVLYPVPMPVDEDDFLLAHSEKNSARNDQGFGSTGI